MPNFQTPVPILTQEDVEAGDKVIVTDETDALHGSEGEVVRVHYGFPSTGDRILLVEVRLDQRMPRDDQEQNFYASQLGVIASRWNRG